MMLDMRKWFTWLTRPVVNRGIAAVAVATFFAVEHAAFAQHTTNPPDEEGKPIIQWVCVILFTGITVAISCKNPKRTHLS